MVKIFTGNAFAKTKEQQLIKDFAQLPIEWQRLKLVDILEGNDQAARLYVNLKKQAAQRVGINFETIEIERNYSKKNIISLIKKLNQDRKIGGIMIQLPLSETFRKEQAEIVEAITAEKDVDCLVSKNLNKIITDASPLLPATVRAIIWILEQAGLRQVDLINKRVVIVGRSRIVGKPLADFLNKTGALVTICHRQTQRLSDQTKKAQILISATGQPNLIKKNMVSLGAVVIDVGSPRGDVDFDQVKSRASFITPVPGGVGPITVISLLENFKQILLQKRKNES